MFAVRAAILAVLLGLLSSPSTIRAPHQTDVSSERSCLCVVPARFADRPPGLFSASALVDVSRFSPWKARPKIVLAEADHRLSEETDLGPVLFPSGLSCLRRLLRRVAPRLPLSLRFAVEA